MKKGLIFVPLLIVVASFSGCRPIRSEMFVEDINRNSNFEINLLTPADEADFSDFNTVPGMGVTGYYNKKYGDMDVDYDAGYACYVQYDVTCYPDVAFGEKYVTGIRITDPDIHVYGYSVGDSYTEFLNFLEDKGYDEYYNSGRLMKFSKGRVEIRCGFEPETQTIRSLYVGMDLTNRLGVIF